MKNLFSCFIAGHIPVIIFSQVNVSFTGAPASGCAPLCVQFTNTTPNAATCFWQFGDGGTSTQCNPNYCYLLPGAYSVTLTVTDNNNNTGSYTANNYIALYPNPVANFSFTMNGLTAFFADLSAGNPVSWYWSFGDATTSTQQNPVHNYTFPGAFNVCLVVSDNNGCMDSACQTVSITSANEYNIVQDFNIYPNPSGGILFLDTYISPSQKVEISMINSIGEKIFCGESSEGITRIDLTSHPAGIYLLKISSEKGFTTRKIILAK
jgi:PKD repeat protein